mgnify:CR=1 FL=1
MSVRVRFAPSPTGPLHIGGVRTALYNYLFAKKYDGQFILRIEDTDQERYVEGAENYIIESLKWLGLNYDEGVDIGGKFAPYRQSERKEIYQKHIKELIDKGAAYYAFDTPEELEQMRVKLENEHSPVRHYCHLTRMQMKNSYTLSPQKVRELIDNGTPYVVRFNIPPDKKIQLYDIIRGEITFDSNTLDDKVLFKSDGLPTYHLANIVDDHLMEITHVIRGEEWLPSLPLHALLYEAFGWVPPKFAHLPLILKPNGKGKLSKRDGDQMGFPVFPLDWQDPESGEISCGYKQWGYLPQAVLNMLALLGWNPGTEQEILNLDELISLFDLEKVQKAGAKFDPEKTKWFNQQHLKKVETKILVKNFKNQYKSLINKDDNSVEKIISLIRDRAVFEDDLWENAKYFFVAPENYAPKALKKYWKADIDERMKEIAEFFEKQDNFESSQLEKFTIEWIQNKGENLGKILNTVRVLIVGDAVGPHLFNITEILGKQETIKRILDGIKKLKKTLNE